MQIGHIDLPESQRQNRAAKRKAAECCRSETENERVTKAMKNMDTSGDEMDTDEEIGDTSFSDENYTGNANVNKLSTYNTKRIDNIAMASIRYGVSSRASAAIATAAWIDAGVITHDQQDLVIDHNKLQRAKDRLMTKFQEQANSYYTEADIQCILFDGRKDLTKVMLMTESSEQTYPGTVKEEHYSVCSEPGGEYFAHFNPDPANDEYTAAEQDC
jgi:hypothetical protein